MPTEDHSSSFGPYRLLHQIGAGGMGQVFLATQAGEHGIRRLVAVKRILSHLTSSPKLVQLFLDEVRIASQINHGNIVQVLDHGSIDGRYFMAMEYVHGENLADVYERLHPHGRRLALDLLLNTVSEVCQGLDHAHRKVGMDGHALGIVHRDISPHNIMLSFQGEVKIADFGVARAAEQTHQTLGGELRGKVGYMSPEQAYGKRLDARSDLFSLALVLYEGLAGENPVARETMLATLEAVRAVEIPPIQEKRPDLPMELTELLGSALAADPEQRPDSARAMHEALQRIMRVNNMAMSDFDLADYMSDLFSAGSDASANPSGATAPGRRADDDAETPPPNAALDQQLQNTLFYLRQRRPDGDLTLPPLDVEEKPPEAPTSSEATGRGHRWPLVAALLFLAGGGLGLALLTAGDGERLPSPTADGPSPMATRPLDASPTTSPNASRVVSRPDGSSLGRRDANAVPARAELWVRSEPPRAKVLLDGRLLGSTPLRRKLPPGQHRLTLRGPHHKERNERLTLKRGKTTLIKRRLEPKATTLVVTSTPPCQLAINGKRVGRTPARRTLVPRGITLSCRHAKAIIRRKMQLRAVPRQEVRLGFGTLAINVQPWARVTIDGKRRGETPLSVVLPAGKHLLRLENPGAKRRQDKTVRVRAASTTRISSW